MIFIVFIRTFASGTYAKSAALPYFSLQELEKALISSMERCQQAPGDHQTGPVHETR